MPITDRRSPEATHCEEHAPFPVRIEFCPLLVDGMVATEKNSQRVFIMIDSEQDERNRLVTLWHETVHLLMFASGIPAVEHNEELIESIAQKLANCCPEILRVCGLATAPSDDAQRNRVGSAE